MVLSYVTTKKNLKRYKNYLNNKDIRYLLTVNQPVNNYFITNFKEEVFENFFKGCFKTLVKKFEHPRSNRKRVLFETEMNTFYIYEKEKDCKF